MDIKEGSSTKASRSLFHSSTSVQAIPQSTTNISLNLCTSSHTIQLRTHKLESEGLFQACNEAGLQTNHGFSRMQNLSSRRAFIHRLTSFFLFQLYYLPFRTQLFFFLNNNIHFYFYLLLTVLLSFFEHIVVLINSCVAVYAIISYHLKFSPNKLPQIWGKFL